MVTPGLVSFFGPEKGIEQRVLVSFATFPDFAFEGVECTDNKGKTVRIAPDDSHPLQDRCNPLRQAALVFSSPVIPREVKEHVTFIPDLAGNRKDYDPWANRTGYSRLHAPHKKGQSYRVWLPELLKAFQEYHVQSALGALRDEFGRTLPTRLWTCGLQRIIGFLILSLPIDRRSWKRAWTPECRWWQPIWKRFEFHTTG